MNPIDVTYSWQTVLLVLLVYPATEAVKRMFDASVGAKRRKDSLWLNRVFMPVVPLVVGGALGVLVPFRPDPLEAYVVSHGHGWQMSLFWGIAVGQFADYAYNKIRDVVKSKIDRSSPASLPPVESEGDSNKT